MLADFSESLSAPAGMFRGDHPNVTGYRFPVSEALWITKKHFGGQRRDRSHTRMRHQPSRLCTLLALYPQLQGPISELDREVEREAQQRTQSRRLMTHPGVGPITALATEVFLGDPRRFADGKAVASYIGIIPKEHSSGGRQRFGRISKQGNSLLRFLWGEAVIHAVRRDPQLRRFYRRKLAQKGMGKARIAAARKLGIRLWVMLRDEIDYTEFCRRGHQRRQMSGAAGAGMLHEGQWS